MKNIIAILSLILLSTATLQAQDINQEHMQRDINIMESVLGEMFKSTWENQGKDIQVFKMGDDGGVQGIYLEDYGLLFTVRGGTPSIITILNSKEDDQKPPFDNPNEQVTKEDIIKRITEFLGDYGSKIGQLGSNDKVTVAFNPDINRRLPAYTLLSDKRGDINVEPNTDPMPIIHVTATKTDLQAYRTDKIGKAEFEDRLSISTIEKDEAKLQDLNIMANILKTTFEDQEDEQFQISSDIDYQLVESLGVLYSFEISYGSDFFSESVNIAIEKLEDIKWDSLHNSFSKIKWDSLSNSLDKTMRMFEKVEWDSLFSKFETANWDSLKFDSLKATINRNDVIVIDGEELKPNISASVEGVKHNKTDEAKNAEPEENQKEAFQKFINKLKKNILDYGGTLDSVSQNERVLFSINVGRSTKEIPKYIVLQIKKSVLEAVDKGNMSREQAVEEITVREY